MAAQRFPRKWVSRYGTDLFKVTFHSGHGVPIDGRYSCLSCGVVTTHVESFTFQPCSCGLDRFSSRRLIASIP